MLALAALPPAHLSLASRPARAAEARVRLKAFAFEPPMLRVRVGDRVVWTNEDDTPHTVTSAARPPLFRSGALDGDDSFAVVFDTPGAHRYFCSLHPHMQGVVLVE